MPAMSERRIVVEAPELRLDPDRIVEHADWLEVFGRPGRVDVEIGTGKGRFLLGAAAAHAEVNYLGVEWANKYLRVAEARAAKRGLTNVRFARVDARDLISAIADRSVTAYYVFYPDPWPKKRHNKRRFLQPQTLDQLARTQIPGGAIHVATDHEAYWEAILAAFGPHPAYERLPSFGGDDFPVPIEGPLTNYEEKYGKAGRTLNRASWRRS